MMRKITQIFLSSFLLMTQFSTYVYAEGNEEETPQPVQEEIAENETASQDNEEVIEDNEETEEPEESSETEETSENLDEITEEEPAENEKDVQGESAAREEDIIEEEPEKQDEPDDHEIIILSPEEEQSSVRSEKSNDELLQQYLDQSFFGLKEDGRKSGNAGDYLKGNNLAIYNILKSLIQNVAEGRTNSAQFYISPAEIGLNRVWTAENLGVDAIVENGAISDAASDALDKQLDINLQLIVKSLMSDLPYDLYWFDKTIGLYRKDFSVGAKWQNGEYVLYLSGDAYIKMTVAEEFRDPSDTDGKKFLTDLSVISSINHASVKAKSIVEEHKNENDYQKLVSYRTDICNLTSYNFPASQDGSMPYGNPWQVIWVFDEDNSTAVVCEGYSKAFKYLCDLSKFRRKVDCITVTGEMKKTLTAGGENHMWNIVTMEDRKHYLTDVTNCDAGMIGESDGLFLKGGNLQSDNSYKIDIQNTGKGTLYYGYDENTHLIWDSTDNLNLSDADYVFDTSYVETDSVSLDQTEVTVLQGETIQLTAAVVPENASDQNVFWSSSDTDIAVVDENGTVTAKKRGTADITVTTEDGGFTAVCTVTVKINGSAGSAYAVLTDNGDLIFFRSTETYENNSTGTFTDIADIEYSGTVYAGIESLNASSYSAVPWTGKKTDIKTVQVAEEQIIRPVSMSYWFYNCNNITSVDLEGFDSGRTRYMNYLFCNCSSLTELNFGSPDTGKVENMADMFHNCSSLTSLDLSDFDTSGVTNMSGMFYNCSGLTSLDLSSFDTSSVQNMNSMFYSCTGLETLDLSDLETSSVTDMGSMFNHCSGLTDLDVSVLDTSNVKNMSRMFVGCNRLTSLDLRGLDTGNVTSMNYIFSNCSNLVSVNLSGLDTGNVTDMSYMFSSCTSLTDPVLSGIDIGSVTDMTAMFMNCSSLENLDLSGFDGSELQIMSSMFLKCSSLKSIDLTGFTTSKVTSLYNVFSGCSSLTSLDLSSFETDNVTSMSNMFQNCSSLTTLDLSSFNTANTASMNLMFDNCTGLREVKLGRSFTVWSNKAYLPSGTWVNRAINKAFTETELFEQYPSNAEAYAGTWLKNAVIGVELSEDEVTLGVNKEKILEYSISPETAENTNVIWTSSNENIAAVDENGKVTGLSKGSAVITVKTEDGEYTDTCTITVIQPVTDVILNKTAVTLKTGETEELAAEVVPENADNKNVVWTSSDADIAEVDENGRVTAVSKGIAVITVKTEDGEYTDTCTITVIQPVTGVTLDKTAVTIIAGKTEQLTATVLPENADNKKAIWTSGNESIAKVDENGRITAVAEGETTVTVSTEDGGFTAVCSVTVEPKPLVKAAYAVLTDNGDLIFFQSYGEYENNSTGTFLDLNNNEYTGTVYAEIETLNDSYETNIPWNGRQSDIRTISVAEGQTIAPVSMRSWFANCSNLTDADFSGFDTGAVTDMSNLFSQCRSLTSLDLSTLDTSKVTTMSTMFANCTALTNLNLRGFDTSSVTDMNRMFDNCKVLPALDVSHFDTSNVTSMIRMFAFCSNLTSLDLSSFNTANVTNMSSMFQSCSKLTSLDLSGFNTANATNMQIMFASCSSLTSLDLSNFNTANATTMSSMFQNCSKLTSLNLSSFNTGNVTNMSYMFSGCSSLSSLDVSRFNTGKVTSFCRMFYECSKVTELDLSGFDTVNATDLSYMFYRCSSLSSLDVSRFNTGKATNMDDMFMGCANVQSLDLSGFDTSKVHYMNEMFHSCASLTELDLSSFDTSRVLTFNNMFTNCTGLKELDISNFDTSHATGMKSMFSVTPNLRKVKLGKKFTKWIDNSYLGNGDWTNRSIDMTFTETDLYTNYPENAENYAGTWQKNAVTGIEISQDELTIDLGDEKTIEYTIIPEKALNKNVSWATSDENIATVDENGKVTAIDGGTAVITVTTEDGGLVATCTVTVIKHVTGITLDQEETAVGIKKSKTLNATVLPSEATDKSIIWTSSDETVATVDQNGKVTGVKAGIVTITAKTKDGGYEASCRVIIQFNDVQDPTKFYYDTVYWAVEKEITQGTSPTTFSPTNLCSRYQFVLFLWRLAGKPEPKTTDNPFKDVKESDGYYKAVMWAVEEGITTGVKPDEFRPKAILTRGQVVTFLHRAAGEPEVTVEENPFGDVGEDKYYYIPIMWAVQNNITTGMAPGQFKPANSCQRNQVVTFLFRAKDFIDFQSE